MPKLSLFWVIAIFTAVAVALTFQTIAEQFAKVLGAASGGSIAPTGVQVVDAAKELIWIGGGAAMLLLALPIAIPFIKISIIAAGLLIVWRSVQKLRGK